MESRVLASLAQKIAFLAMAAQNGSLHGWRGRCVICGNKKSMEWRLGSKKRLVQELEIEVEVFFQRQITSDTLFICHLILSTIVCKNYKETNVHAHTDAIHDQWWHLVVVSESLRHKHRSCPKLQDSEWEVDVTSGCCTELFCAWNRVSLHIHFEKDLTTRRSLFPFPQKLSGYGCCFCSWHDI